MKRWVYRLSFPQNIKGKGLVQLQHKNKKILTGIHQRKTIYALNIMNLIFLAEHLDSQMIL